ncbi:GDSL lipase/acylhydrolase [Flagelloscypha sp. PMI_526]|nr:GDSL lipase/acylhydrolase [Flagelloscypha sp. PMI_526]
MTFLTLFASVSLALLSCAAQSTDAFGAKQFKNLVSFGDSYTDTVFVWDGGAPWPVYATGYTNTTLYPFAHSGGTCSNNITPRPFPSVIENALPEYYALVDNGTIKLDPANTLYSLWIGTNDVGIYSLITGDAKASIVEVSECMVSWVKNLYEHGARNFLFQNMIPLQYTIQYGVNSYPTKFWQYPKNSTSWAVTMEELVRSGNKLTNLMLNDLVATLPGAHVALFDSYTLYQDMYQNPANYLNGTLPLNVTGAINSCVYELNSQENTCTIVPPGDGRDSYLWWDELHPSEQANRIVAQNVAEVIKGKKNKFTKWLS